jgi:glycosyltransferase involved in cell wall biosynthesis
MKSRPTVFHVRDRASEQELWAQMPDKLTVVMPTFNAARTVEEAIRSILTQTYENWVLLVIDDGSTDDTLQICERLAAKDSRIVVMSVSPRGLCGVLNLGLRLSRGQLIARMDAHGVSYPTRFSRQVQFLLSNPSVKVLGTWGDLINVAGKSVQKVRTGPANLDELNQQRSAREFTALMHTSVMAHRDVLLAFGGYTSEDYPAEDTWLWTKIAQQHDVLALPADLVGHRMTANGIDDWNFRVQLLQFRRLQHWLRYNELLDPQAFHNWEQTSWCRRARLYHDYLYRYYFRRGSGLYVNNSTLNAAFYLGVCAVLNPPVFLHRIWKRLTTPGDVTRRTHVQVQML